jgi:hypothetical protein
VSQTLPQTLSSTQVLFSELDADKSGTVPDLVKSRRKHSQFFFKMFDESATLIKLYQTQGLPTMCLDVFLFAVRRWSHFWRGNDDWNSVEFPDSYEVNIKEMLSYVAHGPKRLSAALAGRWKATDVMQPPFLQRCVEGTRSLRNAVARSGFGEDAKSGKIQMLLQYINFTYNILIN